MIYWIVLCLFMTFVGVVVGYFVGMDITARKAAQMMDTQNEVIEKLKGYSQPQYWHWWVGREDDRNDRKEFVVGVVAQDEREAKMKLDQQRIPLLDKARASGVKEVGTHVLVAYSREDIHVQAI
ncbi:MAG: hypothetical protein ACE5FB_00250 [Candidatus Binatia bacterium]